MAKNGRTFMGYNQWRLIHPYSTNCSLAFRLSFEIIWCTHFLVSALLPSPRLSVWIILLTDKSFKDVLGLEIELAKANRDLLKCKSIEVDSEITRLEKLLANAQNLESTTAEMTAIVGLPLMGRLKSPVIQSDLDGLIELYGSIGEVVSEIAKMIATLRVRVDEQIAKL
ncbi:MAG: hypothetical protein JWM11_5319 [Planctomycetaceae bacterium]|nr:hypothetical protein [Planctomycetaceae bacterium]